MKQALKIGERYWAPIPYTTMKPMHMCENSPITQARRCVARMSFRSEMYSQFGAKTRSYCEGLVIYEYYSVCRPRSGMAR